MLNEFTHTDFLPCLNQTFRVQLDGIDPIDLELVSATETNPAGRPERSVEGPGPGFRVPFSLHFLGPVSPHYLVQHIYHLENEQMGTLELFLVPLGPENGRMRYEAIFN